MGQIFYGRTINLGYFAVVHRQAVNKFRIAVDDEIRVVRGKDNLPVFLARFDEFHQVFRNQRTVQVGLWLVNYNGRVPQ